jgi:hypothetical protein
MEGTVTISIDDFDRLTNAAKDTNKATRANRIMDQGLLLISNIVEGDKSTLTIVNHMAEIRRLLAIIKHDIENLKP